MVSDYAENERISDAVAFDEPVMTGPTVDMSQISQTIINEGGTVKVQLSGLLTAIQRSGFAVNYGATLVQYRIEGGSWSDPTGTLTANNDVLTFSGYDVKGPTNYQIRIVAKDMANQTTNSSEVTAIRDTVAPEFDLTAVEQSIVYAGTGCTVTLSGLRAGASDAGVSGIDHSRTLVEWHVAGEAWNPADRKVADANGEVTITGLDSAKKYEYRVTVYDNANNSKTTESVDLTSDIVMPEFDPSGLEHEADAGKHQHHIAECRFSSHYFLTSPNRFGLQYLLSKGTVQFMIRMANETPSGYEPK